MLVAVGACKHAPAPPPPAADAGGPPVVELSPEGLATAQIKAQKVGPGTFTPRLRLAGSIVGDPRRVAQVGARVNGRVTAVRVALGDRVKRGQDLVEVDSAELHQVVLDFRTAAARARSTHDTLARQKLLVEERVGPVQDLRRAEADSAAADAALAEAREHLKFLGLNDAEIARLESGAAETRSRITSPIDGRVAALAVTVGQVLSGSETIATVADLDPIWAHVRVYERDLGSVRAGQAATVEVPTYAERKFDGKVVFVSDVLDPASRSAEVRVSLPNADASLRPGMSANAFVSRPPSNDVIWLPATAVQPHEGTRIVFVRKGERRFEARPVTVGNEQEGFLPIEKGIGADDEVVVDGAFALRGVLERAAVQGD
ncbi:Cobalt/zinc/cadmium efflux RND transporter, membrane fusion protein, CzcB family [Labilithrix luteola]|uniref:Cobalt/zinc/cadmium efflux RND transporter, membrane fusion protein, CzcB family n=1 Tax=Labilithrix luteola TaxID=1391654 RepID=A0A0K1PRV2_9BACT|nr:Cobalt/zinc/cadmium efflux RND transporter, membrane fusion protein, CzcB family [Labilithrix luteola]